MFSFIFEIKDSVCNYYRGSDKPTFWFAAVILSQLIGFLPNISSIVIYGCFICYSIYSITRIIDDINYSILIFLIYIPIQLMLLQPPEMFRSWERLALFLLLMVSVSPLLQSEIHRNCRWTIIELIIFFCVFIAVGSFFARFLEINYMTSSKYDYMHNIGTFGGLTIHSMVLGPTAGIGAIYCAWRGLDTKKWIWVVLSSLSIVTVMFSASRSALAATIAGMTIMIFKLTDSTSKFIKIIVGIVIVGMISYPLWGDAMDAVIKKNIENVAAGGVTSSRDRLWNARIDEFKSHPLMGVGFDAMDISSSSVGVDTSSGQIESGSSWLIIFSMTGIIGAIILFPFFFKTYKKIFYNKSNIASLICGILTLFYIHMIAEGYIFYGGSLMAFMLWSTVGVAYDLVEGNEFEYIYDDSV